jgi:hypothetical protein
MSNPSTIDNIMMRPAAGAIVHHADSLGQPMVYIGRIIVWGGRVSVIPCRGLTNAQAVKLMAAYHTLRDQDVWGTYCNGLMTHVSVAPDCAPVGCVWLPPRLLRRLRQGTWMSTRKPLKGREFYFGSAPRGPRCVGLGWVQRSDNQQPAE